MNLWPTVFFLYFSTALPGAILRGSPSLLWMAADYGDEAVFSLLLDKLASHESVGKPSKAPGGTSVVEAALSKGHNGILHSTIAKPRLFPRCLMLTQNFVFNFYSLLTAFTKLGQAKKMIKNSSGRMDSIEK